MNTEKVEQGKIYIHNDTGKLHLVLRDDVRTQTTETNNNDKKFIFHRNLSDYNLYVDNFESFNEKFKYYCDFSEWEENEYNIKLNFIRDEEKKLKDKIMELLDIMFDYTEELQELVKKEFDLTK